MSFSEKDIVLFEPSSRSMLIDYPELKEFAEFVKLSKEDVKFVWYVSNRTSPIIKVPKLMRIKRACELAYDKRKLSINARIKGIYEENNLPDEIVEAIEVMSSFNPSFRMRAKLLNEHNFDVLQSLVYISQEEQLAMDLDDKKKYADLIVKTTSALSSMIVNMETGYGVKVKKESEEKFELKAGISDVIERVEKTIE